MCPERYFEMSGNFDGRRRILLVTPFDETDLPTSGTPQRLELIKQALRKLGDLTVFHTRENIETPVEKLPAHRNRMFDANVATAMCMNLKKHKPSSVRQAFFAQQRPQDYDVIFMHRLAAVWWTGSFDPDRTLLDMDDIVTQHFKQGLSKGNPLVRVVKHLRYHYARRTESRLPDRFHRVFVCSDADQNYLNHPHVEVLPNSYWPVPEMELAPLENPPGSMLFVGTLSYPPNTEGLAWFVDKVLPRIRQQRPSATLTVIGRCAPNAREKWAWTRAPGVIFKGLVDSVAPFVRDCQFEICPLLNGQGTRIKIMESLAFAKPVVSTRIGAYGLEIQEHEGIILRDDPESFADACIELLDQQARCRELGIAGQRIVSEKYGPVAIENKLRQVIDAMPLKA